jgi:hypothetical protein
MINLPRDSNPKYLEQFLHEVTANPDQSIKLPVGTERGGAFGFASMAIQCVNTWARTHSGKRIVTLSPSFSENEGTRSRLAGTPLGMAALYLAQEVQAGTSTISRNNALQHVVPYVAAMQGVDYRSTTRGTGVFLCCFEGAHNEFLGPLYQKRKRGTPDETTVRGISNITEVIKRMLDACQTGLSEKLEEPQLQALGVLVYQLFNNADIHTTTDAEGSIYTFGLRGIHMQLHRFTDLIDIEKYVKDDSKLTYYLKKIAMLTPNKPNPQNKNDKKNSSAFIEISVFDSGPGLSLRWHSSKRGSKKYSELTLEDELLGVHKCFDLHSTSQGMGYVGDGLVIARKAMIQLKAFMSLRTGRLSLVQDFSSKEHTQFDPVHRYKDRTLLNEISGTSYTICFPLVK